MTTTTTTPAHQGQGRARPPAHDDYLLVIGQVVLDAHQRSRQLQSQLDSLAAGFQAEAERLRGDLEREREKLKIYTYNTDREIEKLGRDLDDARAGSPHHRDHED